MGCSSGGSSGGNPGTGSVSGNNSDAGPTVKPWTELAMATVSVKGGSAPATGGTAQDGGNVHIVAKTTVTLDPAAAGVAPPNVPAEPDGAMTVGSDALAADVSASGTIRVDGTVSAGGADAVRQITSNGGDIFVAGMLRTADLGGARQSIVLNAAGGTVYVTGAVDTSGAAGTGQTGGAISIVARQVVVTGKLSSAGGDGDTTAGSAGAVTIKAGGDVNLTGTVSLHGGVATAMTAGAHGGDGATLRIDSDGNVVIGGTVDARGGLADAPDGAAAGVIAGGAAGAVLIGENAPPTAVAVLIPVVLSGGDGATVGGKGGTITLEPDTGGISIAGPGAIDASGGDSMTAPGVGGLVTGGPRSLTGGGGIHFAGEVIASGGSIQTGGSGPGADGGRVDFHMQLSTDGPTVVDQGAKITVEGGKSGGANVAGGGGHVWLFTLDGDLTIGGTVSVRGGDAPDDGGTGGLGGMVYFMSDWNHNAVQVAKGNLLIAPSGVIDASGGNGTTGGSARSDGKAGSWPVFPDHQEDIAIFLNCDGEHGETQNWMDNQGHLIARGGVHNGGGGDIVYHGIGPGQLAMPAGSSGNHHPPSGNVDMAADGTGIPGDYGGE